MSTLRDISAEACTLDEHCDINSLSLLDGRVGDEIPAFVIGAGLIAPEGTGPENFTSYSRGKSRGCFSAMTTTVRHLIMPADFIMPALFPEKVGTTFKNQSLSNLLKTFS
jgi:hypothetical protein